MVARRWWHDKFQIHPKCQMVDDFEIQNVNKTTKRKVSSDVECRNKQCKWKERNKEKQKLLLQSKYNFNKITIECDVHVLVHGDVMWNLRTLTSKMDEWMENQDRKWNMECHKTIDMYMQIELSINRMCMYYAKGAQSQRIDLTFVLILQVSHV